MTIFDKEAWLKNHGDYVSPWFNSTPHITGQWSSHDGTIIINSTRTNPIEDIFNQAREELFRRATMITIDRLLREAKYT